MNHTDFEQLGLEDALLKAIAEEGYTSPTPIQTATIPSLLEGRDLLGCAQTGTGKTAAFALPMLQLLSKGRKKPAPRCVRALVIAPTRELAAQINESFGAYGRHMALSRACVFGGVGKNPQEKALARGVDILTATPGRLLDLHGEGSLRLDTVEIVVLDEADRMLDMGFIHDVRKIIALLPKKRQTLLFSATMPSGIAKLAATILDNPLRFDISPEAPTVELIEQSIIYADRNDKRHLLSAIIKEANVCRALVFTRTKHGADRLVKSLEKDGIPSAAIHANKSQNNRIRTLENFRSGEIQILVATDLAARGIDVDGITHVFNYELPNEPETYVHRIGRTARAGAAGAAIAFCDSEEKAYLRDIEKLIGKKIPTASGPMIDEAYKVAAIARQNSADEPPERERSFQGRGGRGRRPDTVSRTGATKSGPPRYETGRARPEAGRSHPETGRSHPAVSHTRPGAPARPGSARPGAAPRPHHPSAAPRSEDSSAASRDAIRRAIRDIARGEDGNPAPPPASSRPSPRTSTSHPRPHFPKGRGRA